TLPPPPPRGYPLVRTQSCVPNYETQADSPHHHLLRPSRPARPARRGDLLRHQAGAGEIDRELLARPTHHRLRGAGAAGRGRLPLAPPGERRPPPQEG